MIGLLAPSFDTCIALAEAGFPQQTALSWVGRGPLSAPVLRPRHASGRRKAVAAPTLDEVLAQLPASVGYRVPHPIYGTVERSHSLRMEVGARAQFGYHLPGSFDVRHRVEHARAVEAAARLFIALRAEGKIAAPAAKPAPAVETLAWAA